MHAAAVIVAAGSSSRMGGKVRKPYLKLRGKPILAWTLASLGRVSGLRQIVLVTRPEDRRRAQGVVRQARLPKRVTVTFADGGARRQDSVYNGLSATNADADVVLIHDAARPFARRETMEAACGEALRVGGAILACRVKDTVKREAAPLRANDGEQPPRIETTVPRVGLWLAQTPQIFRRALILELFEKLNAQSPAPEVTDDASICEILGQPVVLVDSSETNFKVTRPEDLAIAEAYIRAKLVK